MKYLVLGFLTTFSFENQVLKNYDPNNQKLSTLGIVLEWIFQEFIKDAFSLTGGKFFITNSELKNQIILKALCLIDSIISIVYLSTLTEIFFYISLMYGMCVNKVKYINKKNLKIIKLVFCFISLNYLESQLVFRCLLCCYPPPPHFFFMTNSNNFLLLKP